MTWAAAGGAGLAQKIAVDIKQWLALNPIGACPRWLRKWAEWSTVSWGSQCLLDRGIQPQPGVINLVTAHRAKGLEWDTVYVVSVTSNDYPGRLTDKIRAEYGWLPENILNPVAVARSEMEDGHCCRHCRRPGRTSMRALAPVVCGHYPGQESICC